LKKLRRVGRVWPCAFKLLETMPNTDLQSIADRMLIFF
jgi:hypothetical protein